MRWLYHIPHVWESRTDRHVWEDVYLLPESAPDGTTAICLTIDALGDPNNPSHGSSRAKFRSEALKKLGDSEWHVDETDLLIRALDMSLIHI